MINPQTMPDRAKPTLTPKLRFPEFRDRPEWTPVSLREASVPVVERVGNRKRIPVSISAGTGFVPQTEKFGRDISGNQYKLYTLVRDGDFVYNKGNSLKFPQGCVYQLQGWGEVATPNVFISFRLKDGFAEAFFQKCFERNIHGLQLRKHITSGARSNGLLNISKDHFFSVEIPTPRFDEQKKIGECLETLDELIRAENQKLDALKAHKKGLMQHLFPRGDEPIPRLRFSEFCGTKAWRKRKISDILVKESIPIELEAERTYREIGVRSHGKGVFHKEPLAGKAIGEKRVFQVIPNALVLNIVFAWEQAIATTSDSEVDMIASHRFPMYVPKSDDCDVRFVKHAFLTPQGKHLLEVASPGGAGRNRTLGQSEFEQLKMLMPDKDEQTMVADVIDSATALVAAQTDKLLALKAHKQGLMQQLFPSPERSEE